MKQYRILVIGENKFYAQVRVKKFLFWSKWEKIWKNTLDIYHTVDNLDYPQDTEQTCRDLIEGYKKSINSKVRVIPIV
jgi:hypothetical protein